MGQTSRSRGCTSAPSPSQPDAHRRGHGSSYPAAAAPGMASVPARNQPCGPVSGAEEPRSGPLGAEAVPGRRKEGDTEGGKEGDTEGGRREIQARPGAATQRSRPQPAGEIETTKATARRGLGDCAVPAGPGNGAAATRRTRLAAAVSAMSARHGGNVGPGPLRPGVAGGVRAACDAGPEAAGMFDSHLDARARSARPSESRAWGYQPRGAGALEPAR